MKKIRSNSEREKDGFTLIELLVVICIIAILTLAAVTSYSGVQTQASVDFAADTLVSTFREGQANARSGKVVEGEEGKSISQCYVIKIVPGVAEGAGLFTTSTDYIAVSGDIVDSCELVSDTAGLRKSDVFNERIILVGEDSDARVYYYKPPFAQIYEVDGGQLRPVTSQKVEFTVGAVDLPQWNRTVVFDPTSGTAKRI